MKLLITCMFLCFCITFQAQSISWKKYYNQGDELFLQGNYYKAGENFMSAWETKKSKTYILEKAGDAYYQANAYMEASHAFRALKKESEKYPLAGLKYARSLKQTGNYDAAIQEFMDFINKYEDNEKELLSIIVQNEIKGCELGKRLKIEEHTKSITLKMLGQPVNTTFNESAPLPVSDELLFFTSDIEESTKFFTSQKSKGKWANVTLSDDFPEIERKRIGSGTLAPDGQTFFFTRCHLIDGPNGLKQEICNIYASRNENGAWTAPIKLNRKINAEGATASHPNVVQMDGFEILFFSSNRSEGQGGMDIWFAMRNSNSSDLDFDYPINLGSPVNTVGDEITPFYDTKEYALYFSSNGHINIGGYDIFKSIGTPEKWSLPSNLGLPFNSPNNDIFFIKEPNQNNGFLASNRLFGFKRSNTYDLDLFTFHIPEANFYIRGKLFDAESLSALKDVWITLYEIIDQDKPLKVLHSTIFHDGDYFFALLPGKHYIMDIKKEGYDPASFDFIAPFSRDSASMERIFYLNQYNKEHTKDILSSTKSPSTKDQSNFDLNGYEKRISEINLSSKSESAPIIEEYPEILQEKGSVEEKTLQPQDYDYQPKQTESSFTASNSNNNEILLTYKVQIIALETPNIDKPRYRKVKAYGQLFTEKIPNKRLYRVLIGEYGNIHEARAIVKRLKNDGVFKSPLIVEYENGIRGEFIKF